MSFTNNVVQRCDLMYKAVAYDKIDKRRTTLRGTT